MSPAPPSIDFAECLKDSPRFRQQLGMNEASLDELEVRLEKMLKMSNTMIEGGKSYVTNQAQFLVTLWEMNSYYSSEQETSTTTTLNKLIQTLQELLKFQNALIEQANTSISKTLSKFLKEEMKQMKETKGYFNKISSDLDSALNKNAAVTKSRPTELEDASNLLTATQSCFHYTGLDYVCQIAVLQSKKKHIVLEALKNFIKAYSSFFNQGHQLMADLEPSMKEFTKDIKKMQEDSTSLEKKLEKRHTFVSQENAPSNTDAGKAKAPKIEGYLFKRGQNAFRTWNRRWFYLDSNKLCYVKRNGEDVTIMEDDLRICLVRPLNDIDRRFCFEVISPTKSHVLQADSESMYRFWLTSLQQGISSALHEAMKPEVSTSSGGNIVWEDSDTEDAQVLISQDIKVKQKFSGRQNAMQILDIPGNEVCCDCSKPQPQWASINFGITLCIECGGIHRSLGVHISKVRSIQLDAWDPEILKVMAELGNSIVNAVFESKIGNMEKPGPDSTRGEKEIWITSKYKEKLFVDKNCFKMKEDNGNCSWQVKRLRRRNREKKLGSDKDHPTAKELEKEEEEEKDIDTSEEPSLLESVLRASTLATGRSAASCQLGEPIDVSPVKPPVEIDNTSSETIGAAAASSDLINAEVLLFGGSLDKHHVATLEFNSDQESTDGEEDSEWTPIFDPMSAFNPDLLLFRAARAHNLPVMCQALALGASTEWKNLNEGMETALHQAVKSGSVMATVYLMLNGAKTSVYDSDGNTPLHMAAIIANTGQVCILLKHHADHHMVNNSGKEPLDLAVSNSDADIVTLLRLAALNEEIRESDFPSEDDTFNDVMHEFSQMVYSRPDRLQRKSDKS